MSYIGNTLPANFQSLPAVQRFNGDGSDTTFTLAAQIANDQSILVSVDGVTQDSNAYSVSGTTLTFTSAPSAGTGNIFVNTISPVGSTVVPPDGLAITATTGTFSGKITADAGIDIDNFNIDGTTIALSSGTMVLDSAGDIVLDADGTAVMFKDAGTEFGRIFNSSTDLVIKSIVSDKDMKFQGNDGGSAITALTLDMSAAGAATFNSSIIMSGVGSLTEVNGNFTVSGTDADHAGLIMATHAILPAEVGAEASANVIDLGANGNEFKSLYLDTSIVASNAFLIDAGTDITLDADGGDIIFKDGGTLIGTIGDFGNNNVTIKSEVSDGDIKFQGNDGGSGITALTLDMSAAGKATFNAGVTIGGDLVVNPDANSAVTLGNAGTNAIILKAGAGDELYIGANDTYAMRILNDGTNDVEIRNGNVIIATAGKGIDFSAQTQSGSTTTSELLDHYEEGTWTPTLSGFNSATLGLSASAGHYTKIGDMVFASGRITVNALNSVSASYMLLGGLPFNHQTARGGDTGSINFFSGLENVVSSLAWDISSTGTVCWLTGVAGNSSSGTVFIGSNYFGGNEVIQFNLIYKT